MPIKSLRLAFALSGLLACSGAAWAQGTWDDTHGRRDQVNDRLADQNERIQQERREHEISAERAQEQHRRDQDARAEERSMAAHDHGHITPGEQHQLNQQENHDSREIGR
jgi:hypothetical protein